MPFLVKCAACGNEVSSDARTCPKCNHPVRKQGISLLRMAALFIGICAMPVALFVPGVWVLVLIAFIVAVVA